MAAGFKRTAKLRWFDLALIVVVLALTFWFYAWTVWPEPRLEKQSIEKLGYYNLLTRGLLKGQLALDTPADPVLATLKDPYDAAQRAGHGLHDASYYKGKYYLYFGVTPVLLLFVPYRVLTGLFIDEGAASVSFAAVGLLGLTGILWAVRKRYFAQAPRWVFAGTLLGLGLVNMMPALLRRASIWEVPITGAHACAVLGLAAIFRAIHSSARSFWLACGSLSLGAAVGGRPVYLLGCAALLVPLIFWAKSGDWRGRAWRRALWAALVPAALVGVGLAGYNWARFDSPFQFGQNYQMSADGTKPVFFSASYLWYGVRLYWLEPAGWSPFFPFVTVISAPPAPAGQLGVENPYGILPNIPYVVLVLGLLGVIVRAVFKRTPERRLAIWVVTAFILVGTTMVTVMAFGGITNRYMVDFLPVIVLLAGCGWLALVEQAWWRGLRGLLLGGITLGLLLYSVLFNVLVSMQHNGLFRAEHPKVYGQVARVANRLTAAYDRWTGLNYGPVELRVVFPRGASGRIEPLVVTGRTFRSDYLYVHYLGEDTVRFGYEHTSYGGATGAAVKIVPGEIHTLVVDLGSLYPPAEHPYFDNMPLAQARLRHRTIRVTLNGQVVLHQNAELYDAVARRPDIGHAGQRAAFRAPFSGVIKGWRVLPDAAPVIPTDEFGPLTITLKWPTFTGARSEPLVSSGETGKGDLVYVKYVDANTVVLGYDHWGVGGFETEPLKVDFAAVQHVGVDYGALYAEGSGRSREKVILRLNGRVVADRPAGFHECAPDTVVLGANLIGASTATPGFSGVVLGQQREHVPLAR